MFVDVVIALGASESSSFSIPGKILAIRVPTGFLGAIVTLLASDDNVAFDEVVDEAGDEVPVRIAAGRRTGLGASLDELAHVRIGKVRAGAAAAPQAQDGSRIVRVYYSKAPA